MKFISVIGPKDQLDTVTRQYICRYEIQLENAMGELKHLNNITPNAELNPYREAAGRAAEIAALYGSKATAVRDMDVDTAMERITEVQNRIQKADRETDALEKELDYVAAKNYHRKLNSIYIGGGTPTTLEPYQLDRLIRKIRCSFDLGDCLEFTVEAGRPDSITEEKLLVLRKNGISRISINPQTMKQKTLDLIGRHHTVEQTIESFRMARKLGFDNINMDLIMGLPEENLADVRNTMEILKELDPDNITIHSLAIKRAARLNIFKDRYESMMMVNTQEHMDLCAEYCHQMGLSPYYLYRQKNMAGNFENVGYAKPGKACLYNILIMEEKGDILACGAGTTTKITYPDENRLERVENVKDVEQYISRIDEMIERKEKLLSDR